MSETGHTPGPWRYDPTEYKLWTDDNGEHQLGEIVCVANGNRQAGMALAYVWDDPERFDAEGIHNARLIAAAPELLETLKYALSALQEAAREIQALDPAHPFDSEERVEARIIAAIQAAEGGKE